MPYIKQDDRKHFEALLLEFDKIDKIITTGDMNYLITRLLDKYLIKYTDENYDSFNGVIGVLECSKQEVYRRILVPYEDLKIKVNGDVYNSSLECEKVIDNKRGILDWNE